MQPSISGKDKIPKIPKIPKPQPSIIQSPGQTRTWAQICEIFSLECPSSTRKRFEQFTQHTPQSPYQEPLIDLSFLGKETASSITCSGMTSFTSWNLNMLLQMTSSPLTWKYLMRCSRSPSVLQLKTREWYESNTTTPTFTIPSLLM